MLVISIYLRLLLIATAVSWKKNTFFFALTMMLVGVLESSSLAREFSKVQEATVSIFRIIDRISKIYIRSKVGTILDRVKGNI
jgi:ATP-binding cassette subfamily B (MDR/TAP) protein 1